MNINIENALNKVDTVDLESILFTLTMRPDWTEWSLKKAKEIEQQYRFFLTLILVYPDKYIVPTKDIDTFWHTHILDTEKYIDDCNKAFGFYIHHFPYFGLRGAEDEKHAEKAFLETNELFKKHFDTEIMENIGARCSSHCRSACGPGIVKAACAQTGDDDRPKLGTL